MVHVQDMGRDDGSVVTAQPAKGRGAWNAELGDDFGIAYGSHEVPKTMVVGPLRPGVRGSDSPILTGASAQSTTRAGKRGSAARRQQEPPRCQVLER